MEYGAKCIRNGLYFLFLHDQNSNKINSNINNENNQNNQNNLSNNLNESEDDNIKQSLLANGSFIALTINNHVLALSYAKELLNLKNLPSHYK